MRMHHGNFSRNFSRARARAAVCASALAAAAGLVGCGGAEEQAGKMTSYSAAVSAANKPELFSLTPEQMSHIQVVSVAPGPLARTLRLTGSVQYNAFKTTPVITQVGGPVSRIMVAPGEHVRAGQPMLYVASPDYSMLRSAYVKAREAFQLADKFYKRAEDLYAHHAIALADLEQAETTRTQAQADLQSSADALRIVGISDPDAAVNKPASPEVPLLAPLEGEVVERLCSPGQLLQAGATQCFTLSDMSSVWVLANVYQNDLAFIHVGDEVSIENESFPGSVHGKISYLSSALDPATRTLQARIEAANPGERLKKEMYVTVEVRAGVIPGALSVPDSAVLRDSENMPYVYLATSENQFARQLVTLGETQGGRTQIVTGLRAGDRVVGDGSLFLQFQNSLQR